MAPGETLRGWGYWCTLYEEETDGLPWSPRMSVLLQRRPEGGDRVLLAVWVPLGDFLLLRRVERARDRAGQGGCILCTIGDRSWRLPSEGSAMVSTLALLQHWTPAALHHLDTMRPEALVDALRDVGAVP